MSGRKSRSHSKEHRDPRKYPGRQQERRSSRESPPPPVSRAQSTARGSPERSKPRRSSRDTPSPPISRAQSTARVQPEKSKHERKASPRRDYPYTPQKVSATRGRSPLRSRHPSSSSSHQGESSGYLKQRGTRVCALQRDCPLFCSLTDTLCMVFCSQSSLPGEMSLSSGVGSSRETVHALLKLSVVCKGSPCED